MGQVVLLSFTAALNPTLVAATTLMLLLPNPRALMLGYLCGASLMSISIGFLIVFSLQSSEIVDTTTHTLSPVADIVLGVLAVTLAVVLSRGHDRRLAERRARRRQEKGPPKWMQLLRRGNPRITFVIGALLTLPGASYLAALTRLSKLDYSPGTTVLVVIGINVVMLLLLEVPLVAFALAPERTPATIERARAWAGAHGRAYAIRGLVIVGALLVLKGLIGLLA